MRGLFIILSAPILVSAADPKAGFVENPEKCEAQWEIRLQPRRQTTSIDEGWPEQLILDANLGGDFKMAQRYMEKFGWFAAATSDQNDLTLYFMPDTEVRAGNRIWSGRSRVAAIPSEGLKRACYAAWISGVPFVRVTKRGEGGESVLYSVNTDNMPVREF